MSEYYKQPAATDKQQQLLLDLTKSWFRQKLTGWLTLKHLAVPSLASQMPQIKSVRLKGCTASNNIASLLRFVISLMLMSQLWLMSVFGC
jgi:hypothetical protein